MLPQKRTAEQALSDIHQNEVSSTLALSHSDARLPSLRWLLERSNLFQDELQRLPELEDQSIKPATPRSIEDSQIGTRALVRQKGPLISHATNIPPDEVVCYGAVSNVHCQLMRSFARVAVQDIPTTTETHLLLSLQFQKARCLVGLPIMPHIAQMNIKVFHALRELLLWSKIRIQGYMPKSDFILRFGRRSGSRSGSRSFQIHVNIQGPAHLADQLGVFLSERSIFLQDPKWMECDLRYHNPHVMRFEGLEDVDIWLRELALQQCDAEQRPDSRGDWSAVLDGLAQDRHITTTSELEALRAALVKSTELLRHQIDGLDFMCLRESGVPKDNNLRYWLHVGSESGQQLFRHRITGIERTEQQREPTGGIFADDMGLGKTLTAISLVVASRKRATSFADEQDSETSGESPLSRTSATLVIVPNTMVMDSWARETKKHLVPGTVDVTVYHGQDRPRHFSALRASDLVVTTYGTVTADVYKHRKALTDVRWFRVILDEAHTIRSQKTRSFHAVMALSAQHHWCLTGTPISNKVEDLGALMSFCRVPLLEDSRCFQLHIAKVATRSFSKGCIALREALLPICLRRTKAILDIPQPRQMPRRVTFSSIERKLYMRLLHNVRRALDTAVSGKSSKKAIVLEAILRLRIFCDQGTFSSHGQPEDDYRLDADEALALLQQADEARCACCQSEISGLNHSSASSSAVLGTCSHLICANCHDGAEDAGGEEPDLFTCPACHEQITRQRFETSPRNSCVDTKCSSKLDAVVEDLVETQHRDKSIVFSYWRKTLDVAATLCSKRGLQYARIDGRTPQHDRTRALDTFIANASVSVLLMTFGTGALGLNLTAATRIHIVEPQWNPAVESQAIGRIIRIGQEAQTVILRYLVTDSVEEQIQTYQKRKLRLAAAGFGRKGEDQAEAELRLLTATFLRGK